MLVHDVDLSAPVCGAGSRELAVDCKRKIELTGKLPEWWSILEI